MIPLVAVVGPTAAGKTRLAVEIALRYGGEVVSCDSMQIYRGMDIGTAKPSESEMRGVPHHLVGFLAPSEPFSVARYVGLARPCIADIAARGKLPVLAGGTGLYYSSLVDNLSFEPQPDDPALREALRREAEARGNEAMLETLRGIDPETASQLHPNNLKRILRAIEVCRLTGRTMAETRRASREHPSEYALRAVGLTFANRAALYARIDRRVDKMMAAGLLEETRALLQSGLPADATALQAIGYKELAAALRGETTLEEAVETLKRGTRRYAKRQLTWFKRDDRIRWIDADCQNEENICGIAFGILDNFPAVCYNE